MSVINSDGKLNVSVIQREVAHDIEKDNLYKAEDDMKKRAIHMSKSYDEFKNFVACSQLQPIQRHEMRQLFVSSDPHQGFINRNRPNKILNPLLEMDQNTKKILQGVGITSKSNGSSSTLVEPLTSWHDIPINAPTSVIELEKEWRYFCTTMDRTLQYILLPSDSSSSSDRSKDYVVPANLRLCPEYVCCKLCKIEMGSGIFGDLILALHHLLERGQVCTEDDNISDDTQRTFVLNWMKYLRFSGGFDLNIAFLTAKQRDSIEAIFRIIKKRSTKDIQNVIDCELFKELSHSFKLK